uniref:CUB domain-containing protein n=1 Tax=Anopheles melas TaxID=34690 RepID=A0A182U3D8_9DIPT
MGKTNPFNKIQIYINSYERRLCLRSKVTGGKVVSIRVPIHTVFHAPMQAGTPFEFRIRYKFISQSEAIVRYGAPSELLELGRVTPGTYCTRQYDECYRKKCRLQSPNYPGMYPRNVTCYWTIRQKVVPTCKHAMVAISQENEHKALVKR